MAGDRYVILGLAHPRAAWFRTLAHWAHASSIPAELVKCLSAEELRARLTSARPFSATLVDARVAALDRDLIDEVRRAGCPTLVVEDRRSRKDWLALGAAAVVLDGFDRQQLLDVLAAHATLIGSGDLVPGTVDDVAPPSPGGPAIAVCGPGGTGASTIAIALCQGLADGVRSGVVPPLEDDTGGDAARGGILLADLARRAEQSVLHDARDVVPGVQELVEAHRHGQLGPESVASLTFYVVERGYHLLLGLRRSSAWAGIRPRAFEAAFAGLRRTFRTVVSDAEADLEGEREGGSLEVEERNIMSRTAAGQADVVLVVGQPGMKGVHSLAGVVDDLIGFGVPADRVLRVIIRAPRSRRVRAELASALAALVGSRQGPAAGAGEARTLPASAADRAGLASPIFVAERRVEECLRDGVRLPSQMTTPLAGAVAALVDRCGGRVPPLQGPEAVVPGSLGHLGMDDPGPDAGSQAALG
jgi:hypothetical protein